MPDRSQLVLLAAVAACRTPDVTFEDCDLCTSADTCTDHGFECGVMRCDLASCTADTSGCGTATAPWTRWDRAHEATDGDTTRTFDAAAESRLTGIAATNGAANESGAEITVGDWLFLGGPEKQQDLGAITFDLSALPPDARIVSATLEVFQTGVTGTVYSAPLTEVVVEHVRFQELHAADEAVRIADAIARPVLSKSDKVEWKAVDVTPAVRYELATCSTRAQLRLTFAPANERADSTDNQARFASDDAASDRPRLVIRHR